MGLTSWSEIIVQERKISIFFLVQMASAMEFFISLISKHVEMILSKSRAHFDILN